MVTLPFCLGGLRRENKQGPLKMSLRLGSAANRQVNYFAPAIPTCWFPSFFAIFDRLSRGQSMA